MISKSERHKADQRGSSARPGAGLIEFVSELFDEIAAAAGLSWERPSRHRRSRRHRPHSAARIGADHPEIIEIVVSYRELALVVLVGALLVFGAWRIIAVTAGEQAAMATTKNSLVTVSAGAALLDQQALHQLFLGDGSIDLETARKGAEQALRLDPLDARAIALLAMTRERQGNPKRADALMGLAEQRTRRDPIVESWLFVRDVQKRNFDSALSHADALLRTDPGVMERLLPTFVDMSADPEGLEALIKLLAMKPPWRGRLLDELCQRVGRLDHLIALYKGLQKTSAAPNLNELSRYVGQLIVAGRYTEAQQAWLSTIPHDRRRSLTLQPYNGDFAVKPSGLPFDWVLASESGARADIGPVPDGGGGNALRIEFSGARVTFNNVFQMLLLPPGHYRLTGLVKSEGLQTLRGLWWRIGCAEPPKADLAHTDLIFGTMPWTRFGANFVVPETGCTAQWLLLELPARTAFEHQIQGEVWFRDLRISAAHLLSPVPQAQ